METSCHIAFEFADEEQLKDPVCYLKKAFLLVEDIMEDTMRFRDETPNARAIVQLQTLSVRLKSCFTKDYEKQDKACVRTFYETPLQLMEKIKNVFNETKNLLEEDWTIFTKNCSDSFAKCSSPDVVTKPDCNCLYPKATPSSDLASVSPHQPLTPSKVPKAGLTWADSEGTEGRSLSPSEQPLHTVDPGNAKHRPPRSTCQSLKSPETPSLEDSPTGGSPQPHPSAGAPSSGMDIVDSGLDSTWALEEASGEASEGPEPQGTEFSPSRPEGGSIQVQLAIPSNLLSASSPLPTTEDQQPPLPKVDPARPTGQVKHGTLEKTDHSSSLPTEGEKTGSTQTSSLQPQGLSNPTTLSAQPQLHGSHSWGIVLPLGELEGKRITRNRRSPAELEGGQASEGVARPLAPFNFVPLTDTGHERQPERTSNPQIPGFVFHLLVPSIILVLLAVGGLLFYRRRRRSRQEPQPMDSLMRHPESSSVTQDEDRQVELPV
ncbi:PREDICTED: macrophage colony-stimulating factor 1 isoform X2 [Chinchilla lanigera]|nr:PREDICTED: macrophage colony-stimulating factor 1 isoform X2 [Chinchilla lanigera]